MIYFHSCKTRSAVQQSFFNIHGTGAFLTCLSFSVNLLVVKTAVISTLTNLVFIMSMIYYHCLVVIHQWLHKKSLPKIEHKFIGFRKFLNSLRRVLLCMNQGHPALSGYTTSNTTQIKFVVLYKNAQLLNYLWRQDRMVFNFDPLSKKICNVNGTKIFYS